MAIKIYKSYKVITTILLVLVSLSCTDETFTNNNTEGIRISISEVTSRSSTHPGSVPEDYIVHTLRILAFDKVTGAYGGSFARKTRSYVPGVMGWFIIFPLDVL